MDGTIDNPIQGFKKKNLRTLPNLYLAPFTVVSTELAFGGMKRSRSPSVFVLNKLLNAVPGVTSYDPIVGCGCYYSTKKGKPYGDPYGCTAHDSLGMRLLCPS